MSSFICQNIEIIQTHFCDLVSSENIFLKPGNSLHEIPAFDISKFRQNEKSKSGNDFFEHFLYDWKIRTYKESAHNVCVANFPVKVTSIHAKVTVILNDSWGVIVSGSANWSDSNKKIELTEISTNRKKAEFHQNWILQAMKSEHTEPQKILKIINF